MKSALALVSSLVVFSGCLLAAEESPSPSPSGSSETRQGTHPGLPGVVVDATLNSLNGRHQVAAVARNQGSATYHVSSICVPPWSDEVRDAQGTRVWPPSSVYCAAFGRSPFKPGDRLDYKAYWNETVYADGEGTDRAPPGFYDWETVFGAARDSESGPEERVKVSFRIRVA